MFMYYILSQNSADSLEDAFNVMRGYNVSLTQDLNVFRMRHLIKNEMVSSFSTCFLTVLTSLGIFQTLL